MYKKIISLTLAMLIFSVSAFAMVTNPVVLTQVSETVFPWSDGTSKIETLTYGDEVHSANLTQWDGTVAESLQGAGTEASPYLISNGSELAKFGEIVNGGEFAAWAVLTSDIHMGNHDMGTVNWKAYQIGKENAYSGTFDGKGYSIINLRFQSNSAPFHGLFGTVSGTVKNLDLTNIFYTNTGSLSTLSFIGGLCTNLVGGKLENITVDGEIKNNNDTAKAPILGGIVGRANGVCSITNCYSNVDINLSRGEAPSTSVQTNAQSYGVGGIVGTVFTDAVVTITNCGNGGDINAPLNHRVAGIAGSVRGVYGTNVTAASCYNTGNITGQTQVAGIFGWVSGVGAFDTNAYNTGTIVARDTENPWASGIANNVQRTASTLGYFYNSADVQVKATEDSADVFAGLRAGLLFTKNENTSGYNIRSQKYYVSSEYKYETADTSEGAEPGATIMANKNVYGAKDGGRSEGNKYISDFTTQAVVDTLNTSYPGTFALDCGINGGKPIFTWQSENPQLLAGQFLIAENKSVKLTLDSPGYIQLTAQSLDAKNVEISVCDEDGDVLDTKKISKKGATMILTFDTGAAAEVTVKTSGRAIVSKELSDQTSGLEMNQLTNNNTKVIKTVIATEALNDGDNAAMVYVHYLEDGTIRGIYYKNIKITNGYAIGKVDLSSVVIKSGDYLKAYLWKGGDKLAPVLRTPAQLDN